VSRGDPPQRPNRAMTLFDGATRAVAVRQVFGEAVVREGVTVIPAAVVRIAAGGGTGTVAEQNEGGGGGLLLSARPVGAWVVRDGEAQWRPAVDSNRWLLALAVVAAVYLRYRTARLHAG
jgi:uncharacterized spore protein YtfJ